MTTLIYFQNKHDRVEGVEDITFGAFFNKEEFEVKINAHEYRSHIEKCSLDFEQIHSLLGDDTKIEVIQDGKYLPIGLSRVQRVCLDR